MLHKKLELLFSNIINCMLPFNNLNVAAVNNAENLRIKAFDNT